MYSQTDYTDGYRQDCSGFVSMCHRLDRSYTTSTLPQVFHQITKDELLPGDILLSNGHVVLFEAWTDSSRTKYIGMEEQTWGRPCKRTVGIPYPYWPGSNPYFTSFFLLPSSTFISVLTVNIRLWHLQPLQKKLNKPNQTKPTSLRRSECSRKTHTEHEHGYDIFFSFRHRSFVFLFILQQQ